LCQELQSSISEGEDKLEAVNCKLNAIMSHTRTKGQFTLKSQLTALRDDFEALKALLRKTSDELGKLF